MCLLKPGQSNALCCHRECKSYYMLSGQECLHNSALIHAKIRDSEEDSPNQTQTTYSPDKSSVSSAKLSPSNSKRQIVFDNENIEVTLNKKKLKSEERKVSEENIIPPLNDVNQIQPNMMNQFQTNFSIPALDTSSLFNNNLLSRLTSDNLLNINSKLNLLSNLQKLQSVPLSCDQKLNLFSSNQFGVNPTFPQVHSQINKINNETLSQLLSNNQENKSQSTSLEEMMRGFQSKTMDILSSQQILLADLSQKNDLIRDTLACLINEVSSLKNSVVQSDESQTSMQIAQNFPSQISASNGTCSSEELISFLHGPTAKSNYQIVVDGEFSLPLYRERNFELGVKLVDNDGNTVENSNKLSVTINLYTCENPPKHVDSNTSGNKILKGSVEKSLVKGAAIFEKVQIKEVSSHFRNGWVFLVIQPKLTNDNVSSNQDKGDNVIDVNRIKPLVLERVIVKAKKSKEKHAL